MATKTKETKAERLARLAAELVAQEGAVTTAAAELKTAQGDLKTKQAELKAAQVAVAAEEKKVAAAQRKLDQAKAKLARMNGEEVPAATPASTTPAASKQPVAKTPAATSNGNGNASKPSTGRRILNFFTAADMSQPTTAKK